MLAYWRAFLDSHTFIFSFSEKIKNLTESCQKELERCLIEVKLPTKRSIIGIFRGFSP